MFKHNTAHGNSSRWLATSDKEVKVVPFREQLVVTRGLEEIIQVMVLRGTSRSSGISEQLKEFIEVMVLKEHIEVLWEEFMVLKELVYVKVLIELNNVIR
uniref:Uncharacterized protein n=1 Tax=Cannabis sativa TaxID=3483 RepID=A0A803PXW0_CANSA